MTGDTTGEESEDSLLGLNYDGFISPLVLAVQELGSLINAVAKKITELFDHVANLRAELTSQNAAIETLKAENAAQNEKIDAMILDIQGLRAAVGQ